MTNTEPVECASCGAEVDAYEFTVVLIDPGDRYCPPEYGAICAACEDLADAAAEARAEARSELRLEVSDYEPF